MNKLSTKTPKSSATKFLWEHMIKLRPDDNLNRLYERIKALSPPGVKPVSRGTLHNFFYSVNDPLRSAKIAMLICIDQGINIQSILAQKVIKYDKDKEVNHWKEKYFDMENRLRLEQKKFTELKKKLGVITSSITTNGIGSLK